MRKFVTFLTCCTILCNSFSVFASNEVTVKNTEINANHFIRNRCGNHHPLFLKKRAHKERGEENTRRDCCQGPRGPIGPVGPPGPPGTSFIRDLGQSLVFRFPLSNLESDPLRGETVTPFVVAPDGTIYRGTAVTLPITGTLPTTYGNITVANPVHGNYQAGLEVSGFSIFGEALNSFISVTQSIDNRTILLSPILAIDLSFLGLLDINSVQGSSPFAYHVYPVLN